METQQNDTLLNEQVRLQQQLFDEYRANLPSKQKHIDKLLQILQSKKLVAITCFEADYKCCHRHVLASSLDGVDVVHL